MAKGSDLRNKLGGMGGPLQPLSKKPAIDLSGPAHDDPEAAAKAMSKEAHDAAHEHGGHAHAPKASKPLGGAGGAGGRPKV